MLKYRHIKLICRSGQHDLQVSANGNSWITYKSWNDARAEIEFILATDEGDILPVEVKSGKRTRAKSLASYVEKCAPRKTFKLTGTQGSSVLEQTNIVMPLYFTQYLPQRW